MLVLQRNVGEVIKIGPDIEVMVTDVRHKNGIHRVKLGIVAPLHVTINRKEIDDDIQKNGFRKKVVP